MRTEANRRGQRLMQASHSLTEVKSYACRALGCGLMLVISVSMSQQALAQNATLPRIRMESDGLGLTNVGVSDYASPGRFLSQFSKPSSGLARGTRIVALYFRLDALVGPKYPSIGKIVVATRLSTGGIDPSRIVYAWAKNEGRSKGPWSRKLTIDMPRGAKGSREPFIRLPLGAPLLVDGDGSVAVDVKFYTKLAQGLGTALDTDKENYTNSWFSMYGKGCPENYTLTAYGFVALNPIRNGGYIMAASHGKGDWQIAWCGSTRASIATGIQYQGVPCYINAPPQIFFPVAQRSSNTSYGLTQWPWISSAGMQNPRLVGVVLWFQNAALTAKLELKLSRGLRIEIKRNGQPLSIRGYWGVGNPDKVSIGSTASTALVIGLMKT